MSTILDRLPLLIIEKSPFFSFAAGTTDGPGEFDFTQGANTTNPFWDFVSGLLKDPSPEQEACHAPKPILLDTGEVSTVHVELDHTQ